MLHRARHLFIRQQTAVINSIRAYLAEFGIVAPVERKGVAELLHVVADPSDKRTSWRRPLFTESKAGCAAINPQCAAIPASVIFRSHLTQFTVQKCSSFHPCLSVICCTANKVLQRNRSTDRPAGGPEGF